MSHFTTLGSPLWFITSTVQIYSIGESLIIYTSTWSPNVLVYTNKCTTTSSKLCTHPCGHPVYSHVVFQCTRIVINLLHQMFTCWFPNRLCRDATASFNGSVEILIAVISYSGDDRSALSSSSFFAIKIIIVGIRCWLTTKLKNPRCDGASEFAVVKCLLVDECLDLLVDIFDAFWNRGALASETASSMGAKTENKNTIDFNLVITGFVGIKRKQPETNIKFIGVIHPSWEQWLNLQWKMS
ncbi:hypothetical protein YC2023_065796 [Brassica napus]